MVELKIINTVKKQWIDILLLGSYTDFTFPNKEKLATV